MVHLRDRWRWPCHKDTSSTFVYALIWMKTAYASDTEERTLLASSRYSPKWRYAEPEKTNCWIKLLCFVFLPQKMCSRRFIKFRLNHWWQMEYSGDAFHSFLGLDSVIYLAVNGTVTNLMVFIQNILNCVPKTNKAFTGLEQHGGKWVMTKFSFWGRVTL